MWALRSITVVAGLLSISAFAATPKAANPPKVVFLGDTITARMSTTGGWPSNWVNLGLDIGPNQFETTAQELARFSEVTNQHPQVVHIIPGIGDIEAINEYNQYTILSTIEANVGQMITEAKAANIKVVLGTIAPVYVGFDINNQNTWGMLNGFQVLGVNAWIESYGAANGIPVVNYHDMLCGLDNVITSGYSYAYNCVGSTDPNQGIIAGLPFMMEDTGGFAGVFPSASGNTAMIQMAQTAIATLGLTVKGGYLGNTYYPVITGTGQLSGVNNVPAQQTYAVQFVPYATFSDGVTRPIVNTNFAGQNGIWSSSNPSVMTINQDGTARALAPGKTRISYTSLTGQIFSPWDMTIRTGQ